MDELLIFGWTLLDSAVFFRKFDNIVWIVFVRVTERLHDAFVMNSTVAKTECITCREDTSRDR